MSKPRSDSLFAHLTPDQREQVFIWLLDEARSYEDVLLLISEQFGVNTSKGSLHGFLSRHGFTWRLARARSLATLRESELPADWEAQKRQALAAKEFELAYSNLSSTELIQLRRLDLDERAMKFKGELETRKLALAERRVAVLEKKIADAQKTLSDPALSMPEREARMKEMFGIGA